MGSIPALGIYTNFFGQSVIIYSFRTTEQQILISVYILLKTNIKTVTVYKQDINTVGSSPVGL